MQVSRAYATNRDKTRRKGVLSSLTDHDDMNMLSVHREASLLRQSTCFLSPRLFVPLFFFVSITVRAQEQRNCTPLKGTVTDSTGALLPGASVSLDTQLKVVAGSDGSFVFHCVPPGKRRLTATAGGFKSIALTAAVPFSGNLRISLMPSVQEVVTVTANGGGASSSGGAQGLTVSGEQLQTFADDPDDLQRQLQQLGAYAGGSPTNAGI